MKTFYGIDLGTTNCVISKNANGISEVINLTNNDLAGGEITDDGFFASCMAINKEGKELYGKKAKGTFNQVDWDTIYRVKDKIGIKSNLLDSEIQKKKKMNAEKISTQFISRVINATYKKTGDKVEEVVISVPAKFTSIQREATIRAAKAANLKVLGLIDEPTAAALVFSKQKHENGTYLVYDLGGGTFDISIINIKNNLVEVLTTDGDRMLGGLDFDIKLAKYLYFQQKDGTDWETMLETAEIIKKNLSKSEVVEDVLKITDSSTGKNELIDIFVSRDQFNELIAKDIDKTIKIVKRALDKAKIDKDDLKGIILIGGSTYIPLVREELSKNFPGIELITKVNPNNTVANGASIKAAILKGEDNLTKVEDIVGNSIGVTLFGGFTFTIIDGMTKRNDSISHDFYKVRKNQTSVSTWLVEGGGVIMEDVTAIAQIKLNGLSHSSTKVRIVVSMDDNGVIHSKLFEVGGNQAKVAKKVKNLKFENNSWREDEFKLIAYDYLVNKSFKELFKMASKVKEQTLNYYSSFAVKYKRQLEKAIENKDKERMAILISRWEGGRG